MRKSFFIRWGSVPNDRFGQRADRIPAPMLPQAVILQTKNNFRPSAFEDALLWLGSESAADDLVAVFIRIIRRNLGLN